MRKKITKIKWPSARFRKAMDKSKLSSSQVAGELFTHGFEYTPSAIRGWRTVGNPGPRHSAARSTVWGIVGVTAP